MGGERMEVWGLPEGWDCRPLGEIAPANASQVKPCDLPEQEFHYLGLDALPSGGWVEPTPRLVKGIEVRSNCIQYNERHVLYAKLRPYLNKVVVPTREGVGSTEFVPLMPDGNIIAREFLAWYLRSPQFVDYAVRNSTGARMPRIRMSALWNAEIPLPPLDEQRRIVARIEELFARIEEAQRLRAAADQDAERLMLAALEEVFEEAETKGWPISTVGDVIESKPQYGTSQKASEEPVGVPVLRMGNIVDGQVSFDDLKYIDLPLDEEAKYILHEGDLLFNRTNSAELVGKSAVYPGGRQAVFASYLIRIVADRRKALPHFVVAYINSPLGRQYIQSQLTRAIGQVNVNAKKLQAMPIPVPSLPEQRRIVEYLDSVQAQATELKRLQTESAVELERLSGAVLARAFRGEL